MNVFSIDGHVADVKYRGAGYAVAAHDGTRVLDLVYLRDALDGFDDPSAEDGDDVEEVLQAAMNDDRLRPAIEQLRPQGAVSFGMCSCYEFVEL